MGPLNYPENPESPCVKLGNKMHLYLFLWQIGGFFESQYQWIVSAVLPHHQAGFNTKNFRML